MAKSALLEQYSNIWIDKHDYLEAERIYYEGKLGSAAGSVPVSMGRKNKSKQSAAPPPTPLSPLPSDSPLPSPVMSSEPAPKVSGPQGGKGKNNKGPNPAQQAPKQPQLSGEVSPLVESAQKLESPQLVASPSVPSPSPDSGTQNKGAQTCKAKPQGSSNKSNMKPSPPTLAEEVAKAQEHLKKSLECMDGIAKLSGDSPALLKKISALETENQTFKKDIRDLTALVQKLELRLSSLESSTGGKAAPAAKPAAAPAAKPAAAPAAADDDVDLFGSDSEEENEEAAKIREERLAAYNAKKSKKPVLIAKSNIILDVKPWGDDTDMKEMERQVRAIQMEGLLWGASKLAPLAYGINKLQISCVVEDELVSVDALTESIQDIEEYVQSVDIAAFNKV